ncbi:hypothetical protein CGLO_14320 [Colletotrichum gloeosporioides Cg-14]|uniref:Uncharacterized protein n=1 Tax=Colletotrichum gloeosporioides (strain Cg-14) TaxID=1237896 RepID=T0LE32_COLGC|nr:hypothetical protein CGLO_14320 [Colletotrichum gloeosporioides Cg-14]
MTVPLVSLIESVDMSHSLFLAICLKMKGHKVCQCALLVLKEHL